MAAKTGTYTLIASNTLGSATSSITFSSIPAVYTDLILVSQYFRTTNNSPKIYFNSDTLSNYSQTVLYGNGTSAASGRDSGGYIWLADYINADLTNPACNITNILDYSNTSTYKTVLDKGGNAANGIAASAGLWRNTSAINSIVITATSGNFNTGSTFKLYGIEAGNL